MSESLAERSFRMRTIDAIPAGRGMAMRRLLPALVMVFALGLAGSASACPNCKEAVAAQPAEAAEMKNGYNYSVLFMLAMPFSILSIGSFMVVRAVKRGALPEM